MSFKKSVIAFILVYVQVLTLVAAPQTQLSSRGLANASVDLDTASKSSKTLVMDIPTAQGKAQFSYTEVPLESPAQLGEFLERQETRKADVILSTDTPEIYEAVAEVMHKTESRSDRQFRFMPIGKLASTREKLAASWADYTKNVKETVKYDKLGLSIAIITTTTDSLVWIHSGSLDVYQKSAMVMLNVIFTAAFALDPDMWTKMITPLNHRFMKTIDKLSRKISGHLETEAGYARRVLASQFLSNLTFSVGFQFLRSSIISFHELATTVMSSSFWMTSIKVAMITTAASFAWSELMGAVDAEKNPVAKNALKRIGNVRNLIMSQLASMGMVLQPEKYGYSPIVAIVVSGSIGLIALLKSSSVIRYLERSRWTNVLFRTQRSFENLINEAVDSTSGGGVVRSCGALFVN